MFPYELEAVSMASSNIAKQPVAILGLATNQARAHDVHLPRSLIVNG